MDPQAPSVAPALASAAGPLSDPESLRAALAAAHAALESERAALRAERAARRYAEAALEDRERKVAEVEQLARLGSWEWHLPSDTITWSGEQLRIHGLDPALGEQTFAQFLERVHPDDRDRVVAECDRLVDTGEPFSFPYRVVRPDGSLREMHALGKRVEDASGQGYRMVGSSRDVTDQNRAERELRASEARWRDLFEQFPHSVKVYAPDGRVTRVNAAYARMWGLSLETVANFNPLRDVDAGDIGAQVRRAFQGETVMLPAVPFDPREYSAELTPPGGVTWPRWVQASYFPIRGPDGEVMEVVAVHHDVTEQRQAEAALRASEASYRALFEHSNDAILVLDATGVVVDANRRACEMCGTTLEELRTDPAGVLWNGPAPFTPDVARDQTRRAIEGEAQRFEWMSIHPRTGAPIWGEVSLQRVVLGGAVHVMAVIRDIGGRKAAEEALRASEASYRALFELSNDPIYLHDVETGAILDANRRACEAAGMTVDELRRHGMRVLAGGPPPFTPDEAAVHLRRAAAGEPQRFEWMTGAAPGGGQVWSEVSLNRVTLGGTDRLLATARDITERKQAEQALRDREESYRTIFEMAGAAIWVQDVETGAFLDVNQTACEVYGYSVDEQKALGIGGLSWGQAPWDRESAAVHVARALAGEPERFEWCGRHRQGHRVWTEVTLRRVSMLGEDRLLATAREISDRKAAEAALHRANEELEQRVRERTDELAQANEALEEEVAEHEAAREALAQRTGELEGIFRALPDLYFRLDADGLILDSRTGNDARYHSAVDGFPTDLRTLNVLDVLPVDARPAMQDALRTVADTGRLVCVEYTIPIDGERRDTEARVVPVDGGDLVVVVRDMTEQKAAERELERRRREAEQVAETLRQQALVFETLTEAVVITDARGRIADWNPAAERMFGHAKDDVLGRSPGLVNPPDREAEVTAAVMAGLEREGRWSGEVPFLRPDGTEGVAEMVIVAQYDEAGRRIAHVAANRDITERRAAEEALRRSEEHFRSLIENASDVITVLDGEARIEYESPAVQRVLGYAPAERVGLPWAGLVHPDDAAACAGACGCVTARPGETAAFELRFRHRDGGWRTMEGVLREVGDGRVVVNARDATERRRAEAEVVRQKAFFEEILGNLESGVAVFTPDLRYEYASPNGIRDPELRAWVVGRTVEDYGARRGLPAEVVARRVASLRRAAATGRAAEFEEAVQGAGGGTRHMLRRSLPLLDSAGRLLRIIGYSVDITERVRMAEALRESEEHFRALIENAHDITCILDPAGGMTYQSPSLARLLGWEPEDLIGRSAYAFIHPDDVERVRGEIDAILAAPGTSRTVEYRFRHRDGAWRMMEAIGRTLSPAEPDGVVANIRDVTERWEAEQALQRSEEHFRAVIENGSDLLMISDASSAITYVGPSVQRLLGRAPEELLGRDAGELVHPDDLPALMRTVTSIAASPGVLHTSVWRLRHADGTWRTFEALGKTLSPQSAEAGLVVNARDVTEREQAERVLQEREEHFRRLIENAHDITCILELDGRMRYLSPSVAGVLGYPAEALQGRNAFEFMHPDDVPGVVDAIRQVIADPESTGFAEYRFRHGDGSWRHLEAVGRIMYPASPESGFVSNIRDVTERKQAAEALREATHAAERARAEAERANLAKSEFLSRMSHELRTPMNSILGFGQVLARGDLRVDQQKHVQHILKAGRHLLRLINEVLEIARIEAGRQSFSLEPVHVGTVLQEAVGLVRPMAEQHGVQVDEAAGTGRDGFVHADRQRLTQVLLNLLSNAIKYNRAGGRVRLRCDAVPDADDGDPQVWIRVEDTGQGIPEARAHQLFTPFARLGAEQTEVEGTGLGLALSLRLAEAMGGTLALESTGPEGSVFRLALLGAVNPLRRAEDAALAPAAADGETYGEATLLYVEDNLANLSLVETFLLTRPGWRLIPALQGRIGAELAREHRPDLVLLDLHLPDIPGEEVLRRLRADGRTAGIPVIVISADATHASVERLRQAGADAYLTKPLDLDEFLATLQAHLSARDGR